MARWTPGAEDYQRVFREQNPWHAAGTVPEALAPPILRPLAKVLGPRLLRDDLPRRFQLILGPRRVGKTTVMYQTARMLIEDGVERSRVWWARLDHPLLMEIPLGSLVQEIIRVGRASDERPVFVFLDEVVYADRWDLWLKTFYDERWPVRIVASSSATAALADRRAETGVGRWEEQYLAPYLLPEWLDLAGQPSSLKVGATLADTIRAVIEDPPQPFDLRDQRLRLLLIGGFPELLVRGEPSAGLGDQLLDSQRILRSDAVERAVYKDIPQSFDIENPMALERLLYVLAGQVAGILSPTAITQQLGLSQPTFDRYLSYFERTFLVFTATNYSGSEVKVQRRGRRLYFVDTAIRNAALQRGLAPLDDPGELGILQENLGASHLHALARQQGLRLFHWRDAKAEVDLILDGPDRPLAFELASSADHHRSGLQALAHRHGEFDGGMYLVAPNAGVTAPERNPSGIGTLPLDLFLVLTGLQADRAMRERLAGPDA